MICYYADLKNHNFSPTLLVKKWLYLVNAQFLGLGRPSSRAHCDQESWPIFDFLIANERFFHKLQVLFISYWAVAWSCGWKLAKCRFLVLFRGVIIQNHSITLIAIFSKSSGYFFLAWVVPLHVISWSRDFTWNGLILGISRDHGMKITWNHVIFTWNQALGISWFHVMRIFVKFRGTIRKFVRKTFLTIFLKFERFEMIFVSRWRSS